MSSESSWPSLGSCIYEYPHRSMRRSMVQAERWSETSFVLCRSRDANLDNGNRNYECCAVSWFGGRLSVIRGMKKKHSSSLRPAPAHDDMIAYRKSEPTKASTTPAKPVVGFAAFNESSKRTRTAYCITGRRFRCLQQIYQIKLVPYRVYVLYVLL